MIVFKAHTNPITSLVFSPLDQSLATACIRGTVRVWRTPGEPASLQLPGGEDWSKLAFSPDGKRLAWVGRGIRVWDVDNPQPPLLDRREHARFCCFSPDGAVLFTFSPLLRWDCSTWTTLPAEWNPPGASAISLSPDGSLLALVSDDPDGGPYAVAVSILDSKRGAQRARLSAGICKDEANLAFLPDGQFLAGTIDNRLHVWTVPAGTPVATHTVGTKHFKGIAFTPDGTRLVTVSNDETARLWETSSWTEVGSFAWKAGKLRCVAVSGDGMRMAAGGHTGKVVVWDVD